MKARKTSSIRREHRRFLSLGRGKKANASKFFNVIHSPILDIPVRQVCPPYLHILLGIVKKHHDLLEEECHRIDEALGRDLAKSADHVTSSSSF